MWYIVNKSNKSDASLAMNTLDTIPNPNLNSKNIAALIKDGNDVTGYKLSDGTTLSKENAIALAKSGGISGVGVSHRNGKEYLKSLPDETEGKNLSKLPTIDE